MTSGLDRRVRSRGAAVRRTAPGKAVPSGDRWIGAEMALETVQHDVRKWCEAMHDA